MALTVTYDTAAERVGSGRRRTGGTLAFDTSYPTGGEVMTPRTLGLSVVTHFSAQSTAGYVFHWDKANAKLMAFYGDYSEATDGALVEVADQANLSTPLAAVRWEAEGF